MQKWKEDDCVFTYIIHSIPSTHVMPALFRTVVSAPLDVRYAPKLSPYPYV